MHWLGHTRRHDAAEATLVDLAGALAETTAALGEDWANQLDRVVRAWEASAAVAHDEADSRLAELVACMEEAGVIARDAEGELSGQLDVLVERLTTTQGEMEAAVEALEVRVKERAAAAIVEATSMLAEAGRAAAADLGIAETRLAARMDTLAAQASQDHTSAVDRCYFQPSSPSPTQGTRYLYALTSLPGLPTLETGSQHAQGQFVALCIS